MSLALFDLDHTLIAGDSGSLWAHHLIERGAVDAERHARENGRFEAEYRAGTLDFDRYTAFALEPLAAHPLETLLAWRVEFVEAHIRPVLQDKAFELLERHRDAGDTLVIVTATNRFVTEPIAELLGVPHLLATEAERIDGRYTGRATGVPCFQAGKIRRLEAWRTETGHALEGAWFYSDSHNDIPLLAHVARPVAVDPDPVLAQHARSRGWPVISLRG